MTPDIVTRLRNYDTCHDGDVDEAADMLEFFFDQMQMLSPKMTGQHSYYFRHSGWPMNQCRGPNAEAAIRAAISAVKHSQAESRQRALQELADQAQELDMGY